MPYYVNSGDALERITRKRIKQSGRTIDKPKFSVAKYDYLTRNFGFVFLICGIILVLVPIKIGFAENDKIFGIVLLILGALSILVSVIFLQDFYFFRIKKLNEQEYQYVSLFKRKIMQKKDVAVVYRKYTVDIYYKCKFVKKLLYYFVDGIDELNRELLEK
ncbi:MAG: hypothetical protein ACI4M6_00050 [Christensenellaceae bacterium]